MRQKRRRRVSGHCLRIGSAQFLAWRSVGLVELQPTDRWQSACMPESPAVPGCRPCLRSEPGRSRPTLRDRTSASPAAPRYREPVRCAPPAGPSPQGSARCPQYCPEAPCSLEWRIVEFVTAPWRKKLPGDRTRTNQDQNRKRELNTQLRAWEDDKTPCAPLFPCSRHQ